MTEKCLVMLESILILLVNPFVGLINVVKSCFVPKVNKKVTKHIVSNDFICNVNYLQTHYPL